MIILSGSAHLRYCVTTRSIPSSFRSLRSKRLEGRQRVPDLPQHGQFSARGRPSRRRWRSSSGRGPDFFTGLKAKVRDRLICGDRPVDDKKAASLGVAPCVPIPPVSFQALAMLQTIVSALCVFFIALALRNYFRMR